MRRRILLHAPSLAGGGAERVIVLMANELAARGHDVTLLTWNGTGPNGALRSPQVQLVDFDYPIIDGGFGTSSWAVHACHGTRALPSHERASQ